MPVHKPTILLAILPVLTATGCAKLLTASESPSSYSTDDGDYGGQTAADFASSAPHPGSPSTGAIALAGTSGPVAGKTAQSVIEPPPAQASRDATIVSMAEVDTPARAEGGLFARWKEKRADRELGKRTRSTAAPDAKSPTLPDDSTVSTAAAGEPEPAIDRSDIDDHGRQIVYTAMMQVSVFDLEEAMRQAERLPERVGGYVQSMSANQVVLKIPAAKLRTIMDEIGKFGVVEARTLDALDVTDEYLDLETRIRVLQETRDQLLALLHRAKSVEEALHVRHALDDVTMQLEHALGRMRQLSNLISFSTLTLTLVERGPHQRVPSSNDPFPWVDELGVEATEWR